MLTVFIVIVLLIAVLVLVFFLNLWASLKVSMSDDYGLTAEIVETTHEGLLVKLSVSGFRAAMVDGISMPKPFAVAAGASAPSGFISSLPDPMPKLEDFEPDLDELVHKYESGTPPEEKIMEETRRQYEEAVELRRRREAEQVSWTGAIRVSRGKPKTLLLPMTEVENAKGRITFGYSYRVGLLSGNSAASLTC
jgi:hypothetical protein